VKDLQQVLAARRAAGLLGTGILGQAGFDFDIQIHLGAGAYVCGEETSLLNSLEGKRGEVRAKPPLPALEGLFGKPTIVNNVLTLAAVPWILTHGGDAYAAYGAGRSKGTMPIQIAGNVKHGGLYEVAFGITLGELVNDIGGGTASGRPVRCVQVGGPLGAYIPPAQFHLPLDYEAFAAADALVGLYFLDAAHAPRLGDDWSASPRHAVLQDTRHQLLEYFEQRRRTFDLPLRPTGTPFQLQVWQLLREIPWGTTTRYGVMADQLAKPGAARAVGAANSRNPISIIVPCHRAIGADGRLVGYAGGIDRKAALLELEGVWRPQG
jgi:O-6-methylguanine DNA methyltransferase